MGLSEMPLWLIASFALLWYVLSKRTGHRNGKIPLPPGPPRLAVIGNALDVPTSNMAQTFNAMSFKYGDIVYLDAFDQPMIILGTHEAATELLEKRSAMYSDRTASVMASLSGWDWNFTLHNYGSSWRRQRKLFHQHFNSSAILSYQELQEREARRFALRLIEVPKNLLQHIRFVFSSSIMRITYGIELSDSNDEYLDMAEAAMAVFNRAFIPGKYPVETLPILRFLPSWFPDAKFKREGRVWTPIVHRLRDTPWERTVAKIRDGTAIPSIATSLMKGISNLEGNKAVEEEAIARNVTAVVYAGGADTTLSTVQTLFLAMASFPGAQKKAQAELDAIVGSHRLPEFSDKESLPYTSALIKECLRWRPVVPTGFPHRSVEDDSFRGYFIPKGTIVVPNVWAYSRDPKHYPVPETFAPDRFLKDGRLNPDVLDPTFVFGYGRRICPGRHYAEATLFMLTATVLHTLAISAPLDAQGDPVTLEGKMTQGVISYPEPFEVDIKSRGSWAELLLRERCNAGNEQST